MIALLASVVLTQTPQAAKQQELPSETDARRKPSVSTNGDCLIRGGTLITVTGPVLKDTDLLVRDGKIAAIGRGLQAPAGVVVIDAKGKIVSPGIVDAHSHMAATSSVNEWTDAVVPEVRIADILDPEDSSFYEKLAAGFTSALVLHGSSNPIGGESQIIKLRWKRPLREVLFPGAPRIVKFALGENVKQSNSSQPQTRFPATRMGIEAVFRRAFAEAENYMIAQKRYEANRSGPPPRRDVRLDALADILRGNIIIHCHAYRQDEMLMLTRVVGELRKKGHNIKLMAFTHALEGYKIAPELAERGVGVSLFADAWSYKMEVYDAIPYAAALCWQAGVLTSVNTDTGSGMTPVNMDAAKAMRFGGVPPEEAIKFVTINPAKQLGIDKRVGSLEVGKDADIAIWEGHPLSVYSRCAMTLVDGEVFFQRVDRFGVGGPSVKVDSVAPIGRIELRAVPDDARAIVLRNANIHPMNGTPGDRGSILIRDGKIAAVGSNVGAPSGAFVLDVRGLDVYPGFIDAQSQIARAEVGSVRATLDTTDLGRFLPDLVALTSVNPESDHIATTRLGGVAAAITRPLGPPIAGQGSLMHLGGWTTEQMGILPEAALYVYYPAGTEALPDWVLSNLSPEEKERRENFAKEQRKRLRDYLEMGKRYLIARREDPAGTPPDPRLEALAPYLNGNRPTVISATTAAAIREAVKLGDDLNLKLVISGGKEAWRVASLLADKKVPVILEPASVTALEAGGNSASREYDPWDSYLTQPAILHRAGVLFAFGSGESSTSYELPLRAGLACAYGLPRNAALNALTVNPARIFGVQDQLGTIEAGKLANLIVVDGDPLEISTSVRAMFINGKAIPLESRWTKLYQKYRQRLK